MGKIYAVEEDTGDRRLVRIECDYCDNQTKPHSGIVWAGWEKCGWDNGPGTEKFDVCICPECVAKGL
jgi:hypothetical protein